MAKRFLPTEFTNVEPHQAVFVLEYVKDFNTSRASIAAGISPTKGAKWRDSESVSKEIQRLVKNRQQLTEIDAEWLMWELVDNHLIARQAGNISQSTQALNVLAKHAAIDAFAAEKVLIATDQAVMERLQRSRKRASSIAKDVTPDKPVSFF